MKRYLLITILALNADCYASTTKPDYNGAFDESIYDQSTLNIKSSTYQHDAKAKLVDLKHRSLTKFLGIKLQPALETYEAEFKGALDVQKLEQSVKLWQRIVGLVTKPLGVIPVIGEFISQFNGSVGVVSTVANSSYMKQHPEKGVVLQSLYKPLLDTQLEINAFYTGLSFETVTAVEEQYVQKKRDLPVQLQKTIESALIKARTIHSGYFSPIDLVKQALALPLTHKNLGREESWGEVKGRFNDSKFFQWYDPTVQDDMQWIIKKAFFNSFDSEPGVHEKTTSNCFNCLFVGNVGVGKSDAACHLARFLGLPAYEIHLSDKSVLKENTVKGISWVSPQATPGLTADIYLKSGGNPYLNTILIVNDIHTAFKDSGAMGYLLDLLDPGKQSHFNTYFNSPVDWSRVIIILNSNEALPESQKAVRDRLNKIVNFPDITPEQAKPLLVEDCQNWLKKYHIVEEVEPKQLVDDLLQEISSGSLRDMRRKLDDKLLGLTSDTCANQKPPEPEPTPTPKPKPVVQPSKVVVYSGAKTGAKTFASDLSTGSYYEIVNKKRGAPLYNNLWDVIAYPDANNAEAKKQFRFIPSGKPNDHYYFIENLGSGKCLTLEKDQVNKGLKLGARKRDDQATHQMFRLIASPKGGGFYFLNNKHYSSCFLNVLDAGGSGRRSVKAFRGMSWPTHRLFQFPEISKVDSQKPPTLSFEVLPEPSAVKVVTKKGVPTIVLTGSYYKIINKARGAPLFNSLWRVTAQPDAKDEVTNRAFRFMPSDKPNSYFIENWKTKMCLTLMHDSQSKEYRCIADRRDDNANDRQLFQLISQDGGYYYLENKFYERILNVFHADGGGQKKVNAYKGDGKYKNHRSFRFEEVEVTPK